jgi:bis(5'-nucleosidyl)-tetraphosphatase
MQEKSAGAIIFRSENSKIKYLMLLYRAGHWDYVKGQIEHDESEEETVLREAEEETKLMDLEIVQGFKERIDYTYKAGDKTITKDVVFYLAETQTTKIVVSVEHKDYKWLEFDKALKQTTYKTSKDVLKKANKFIKNLSKP